MNGQLIQEFVIDFKRKVMRFKKLRLWATYPFAIVYIVVEYKHGIELMPGVWFVLAGLLVRCWAAGYIKK